MIDSLTLKGRAFRAALGLLLGTIAINVGLGSSATEPRVVAWGALALALVAFASFIPSATPILARVGLDQDYSLGYLAARLFVGWEFLYAGWDKATTSWYHGAGAVEVHGFLGGAVTGSHATAGGFPATSHWFAWTSSNLLMTHSNILSYMVVTIEIGIGISLILGLFLRLGAIGGVLMNTMFLLAGSLSAGLNPEMLILGMVVLFGTAPAVYALTVDRYLLPRLHTISLPTTHLTAKPSIE